MQRLIGFASSLVAAGLLLGCDDAKRATRRIETGMEGARPGQSASASGAGAASAEPPDGGASSEPLLEPVQTEPAPVSSCGALMGRNVCDPISGWPCNVAGGETCDFSNQVGGFICFPPPNAGRFCDPCNAVNLFCGPGTTCGTLSGWCERYCCADSDCRQGVCRLNTISDPQVAYVGVCKDEGRVTCGGEPLEPADTSEPTRPSFQPVDAGQDATLDSRENN